MLLVNNRNNFARKNLRDEVSALCVRRSFRQMAVELKLHGERPKLADQGRPTADNLTMSGLELLLAPPPPRSAVERVSVTLVGPGSPQNRCSPARCPSRREFPSSVPGRFPAIGRDLTAAAIHPTATTIGAGAAVAVSKTAVGAGTALVSSSVPG